MPNTSQPNEPGDPMKADYWTFPMVVAWIAWRTSEAVSANWDVYRRSVLCCHPNGAPKAHFASVAHLLSNGHPQGLIISTDPVIAPEDAHRLLLDKLCDANSRLNVFGQANRGQNDVKVLPGPIAPGAQWQHMELAFEQGDGRFLPESLYKNGQVIAYEPTMARRRVMQLWPASQRKRNAPHANVSERELEQWYKQTFIPFGPEHNSRDNVRALSKQKFGDSAKVGGRLEKMRVRNLDSPLIPGIKTSTSKS